MKSNDPLPSTLLPASRENPLHIMADAEDGVSLNGSADEFVQETSSKPANTQTDQAHTRNGREPLGVLAVKRPSKTPRKVLALCAGSLLLIGLVIAAAFWAFQQIEITATARADCYSLISRANALLSSLKDAETGQRGYILTGNEAFLDPYLTVRGSISGQMADLQRLTSIDAARQHLDALFPLVNAKMVELSQVIELQRNHDSGDAIAQVITGPGRELMESIRNETGSYIQIEEVALAQYDRDLRTNMHSLFYVIILASVLMLVAAFSCVYLIYRETQSQINKAGALQSAIFNSANFSSIATDEKGVIQIFNVGAERMLGYTAVEVMNKITPADISDPQEVIARAKALSVELATTILPGFEALVFKASRGIEDIYELTYIRKDGSRFPAVVSVTALRDEHGRIIGYLLIGTDNSARKRAEAALVKAGALQSAIFNSANFSSIATDEKGVIQIFNVGAERMLGYTAVEVMNKITPADISDPQEVIARAKALSVELATTILPGFEALVFKASRGIEDIYELTYIRKDGSRFPAVVSVTALRDEHGRIIGYLLIGTDNSARKRAEAALVKAGALQSAIFNSANFSSIATDEKGVIQIFNVGAERMLGYTAVEVMNKITPADISDPQEVIARAKALSVELATTILPGFEALVFKASRGIEDIYELTYIRKDGSRFPAVVSVTALRDEHGRIIGYLLIGTDNSARKEIEEERMKLDQRLRDQQFYTRSLIESNIDALMTTDPLGIISDVNNEMETLTGCTRAELIGAPFKNYFTEPARAEAGIKMVLREKKVTDYELTACARDGKKTVVSYNATTFYDRDRKLQGVFAAARNVTERKAAEQLVAQSTAQLQEANKELQSFSYSVSHDLRAPLRHVLGFVDLLQRDAGPTLSEKNLRHLATITEAAKRMGQLIDDLLAFSRLGRAELQKADVNLDDLVRETLVDFQAETKARKIAWNIHPLPTVQADRALLRQVLVNLISNAVKFTCARAETKIEIGCVPSRADENVIFIRDNGAGFDPRYTDKLFGVFQRLHSQAEFEGTGIGLANVQRIIHRHGGRVWAEGILDGGATFFISIPKPSDT